ncbi:AMP-binding protein [Piscinibacter gummiphilus]|uniref:Long-chain-fatty-acid--CoA ligase n=1 Tax=Piscinibacter gummiphilus TaxID=946333 RepID=A0ABZ0D1K0_9BURK|nr:AMP-binding protein [Piscinibacter gummiphilus]WOB10626.1 AMP-binding protein [Piscinibacter gummiphilus]
MDKPWIKHYPPGVPAEIDPHPFPSLGDFFDDCCERFGARQAFVNLGSGLSYDEANRLVQRFAGYLQGLGLPKGARVAVMMPNSLQYPIAVFGVLRAGLTVVNVNPMYTASELAVQLGNAQASAIVVFENFAHTLQQALPMLPALKHVIVTQIGDLFPQPRRWVTNFVVRDVKGMVPAWSIPGATPLRDALAIGHQRGFTSVPVSPGDLAFIQYTGGTTGRPKGAALTHGNLMANVEQTTAWLAGALKLGEETVITALPLYHVFALTANLMMFLKLGGTNVLVSDPRDIPHFVELLHKTRFTVITGVNTLFNALLNAPHFDAVVKSNAGALKLSVAGGMAVQRPVAERWQQAMGVPIVEGYGLSETSPIVCANPVNAPAFTGKLGLPIPSTEVAIMDEYSRPLPLGETGEICVRGPQVMRGYWGAPDETAKVFIDGGWLRTGDIGRMDDQGYVQFVDRAKDLVVVSGFKAYPAEIEEVVRTCPGVADCGVVGVPDAAAGEAVALVVVRSDPGLTEETVREHCRQHLTRYKQPSIVVFRDELPRTSFGKVLRRQLRDDLVRLTHEVGLGASAASTAQPH